MPDLKTLSASDLLSQAGQQLDWVGSDEMSDDRVTEWCQIPADVDIRAIAGGWASESGDPAGVFSLDGSADGSEDISGGEDLGALNMPSADGATATDTFLLTFGNGGLRTPCVRLRYTHTSETTPATLDPARFFGAKRG